MVRSLRAFSILLLAIAFAYVDLAHADPSIDEVYREAHAGHLVKAQEMMREVLRDHPESAKAHYVMADLLAAGGERARAAEHLAIARHLEPGLPFANPESVRELEQRLDESASGHEHAAPSTRSSWSFGWRSGLALIIGLALIVFVFSRRPAPITVPASPANGVAPPSAAPTTPTTPSASGPGLGSALATGFAAGAGIAAGEAVAQRLLDSNEARAPDSTSASAPEPTVENDDLGGDDFGLSDPSSWDDDNSSDDGTDDPLNGGDGWN